MKKKNSTKDFLKCILYYFTTQIIPKTKWNIIYIVYSSVRVDTLVPLAPPPPLISTFSLFRIYLAPKIRCTSFLFPTFLLLVFFFSIDRVKSMPSHTQHTHRIFYIMYNLGTFWCTNLWVCRDAFAGDVIQFFSYDLWFFYIFLVYLYYTFYIKFKKKWVLCLYVLAIYIV